MQPTPVHQPQAEKPAAVPAPTPAPKKQPVEPAITPAEPARSTGAAPSGQPFTFQELQQNWVRIKAAVKKIRNPTEGLLNSCKLMGIKDGALILGFQSELIKSKMEAGDNLAAVHQGIANILGSDIHIYCVVMTSKGGTQSASDLGVDGDGIVGTAINLGGKIIKRD
jgi:DNA polymerase-3 subunit gamma/tau